MAKVIETEKFARFISQVLPHRQTFVFAIANKHTLVNVCSEGDCYN